MVDQKVIGIVLIGMAVVLFFTTFSLTQTILRINEELHKTCPIPPELCPAKRGVLPAETIVSFFVTACLGGLGSFLSIKAKRTEGVAFRKRRRPDIVKLLGKDEKRVYDEIVASDGFIFQSDLVKKTGFSKVKVSRVLDRLEIKGLIERRRRGMANIVILK
jgi:uncharacterized membrane protein